LRNNQKVTNNLIVLLRVLYGAGFEEIQNQRQLAVVNGHGRGKRLAQIAHVHCLQSGLQPANRRPDAGALALKPASDTEFELAEEPF